MPYYIRKTSARCCPTWTRSKNTKYYVDKKGTFQKTSFVTGIILWQHYSCFDLPLDKKYPFSINKSLKFILDSSAICHFSSSKTSREFVMRLVVNFPTLSPCHIEGGCGVGRRLICAFHACNYKLAVE